MGRSGSAEPTITSGPQFTIVPTAPCCLALDSQFTFLLNIINNLKYMEKLKEIYDKHPTPSFYH
jgi:hypothetical protein